MAKKPVLYTVRADSTDPASGIDLTESGLFRALQPMDAPLWYDGRDIVFRDGGPQKYGGWTSPFMISTTGVIRGMDSLQDEASTQRLFMGDQTKLYMWNGSTVATLGTGYAGNKDQSSNTPATTWSFARFGNFSVATNGIDATQIWKATGSYAALANTTFTYAGIVLSIGPHIMVFNTSNGQSWYEWSDSDNPETWTPTSTNAAGNQNIRDMDGGIVAAVKMNDQQIAVLGKNQMFVISSVGSPFFFTYASGPVGIGAVSKTAVVAANKKLYGLSQTGFWASDGQTFSFIDNLAIRDYLNANLDRTQITKVCATYDAYNQQVIWSVPLSGGGGENTLSLAYRVANNSWSILSFGRTAWVPQNGVFLQPYACDVSANIHQHNTGLNANGAAMTPYVQTKPLDCGDTAGFKYATDYMLQMRRLAGTVQLQVGTQKDLTDSISWGSAMTVGAGFAQLNQRRSGRFISLKISSSGTADDWAMSGFDLFGYVGGGV